MAESTSTVSQDDVIARLKLSGAWFETIAELEEDALVAKVAADEGVEVTDDELQEEFDALRRDMDLLKADDTQKFLESTGLTVEQVESMLEAAILRGKLAEKLVDDQQIESYFNQNPNEFEFADISQIAVADAGAAGELVLSIREEGEDFEELAEKHSLDEATNDNGGYVGLISRQEASDLPGDVCDRIFAASPGEVIGPFEIPGGAHLIIRVEEVGRYELDDDLREVLRQSLFDAKMAELSQAAG